MLPWSCYHVWWPMCALLILYLRIFLYFLFIISQPSTIELLHRFCSVHEQGSAVSASIFFGAPVFSFLYFFILHFSENTSPPFLMDFLPWLVGWRAVWALLSTSYYVPDETWQSVEVNKFFTCCFVVIFAF